VEKIVILSYPLHSTPPLGGFSSEYRQPLWYEKTRMMSLPEGEKKFEDMFIRFDVIHERDRRTDRRTDGHCIASRGKNDDKTHLSEMEIQ